MSLALSLFPAPPESSSRSGRTRGACPSRRRAAASSIAGSRSRSSGRAVVTVYLGSRTQPDWCAGCCRSLCVAPMIPRAVRSARSRSVGHVRRSHQQQTDGGRHPDTRRVTDRQMRVQRADQIERQAGERPFLEPRHPRDENASDAEYLGRSQERQQVRWISEMPEHDQRIWNPKNIGYG